MRQKAILAGLLALFLSSDGQLEARGFGHFGAKGFGQFGARGFGHFGASGFGRFGYHGSRGFAFGIQGYGYGYHTSRFGHAGFGYCPPFYGFRFYRSGFPFGYYVPFYLYDSYSAAEPEGLTSAPGYYGEDSLSQPDSGKASEPPARARINPRTNCGDSWAGEQHTGSFGGMIRSVFELQCKNGHPAVETDPPSADGQNWPIYDSASFAGGQLHLRHPCTGLQL
jgi:hypothetical protein